MLECLYFSFQVRKDGALLLQKTKNEWTAVKDACIDTLFHSDGDGESYGDDAVIWNEEDQIILYCEPEKVRFSITMMAAIYYITTTNANCFPCIPTY